MNISVGEKDSLSDMRSVVVSQHDVKLLLAIRAHLEQLIRTAMTQEADAFIRPVDMDQCEILKASASLRALFFDRSPKPMLIGFLSRHGIDFEIEASETNLGLVLLSQLLPEEGHISDYIVDSILNPDRDSKFPMNTPSRVMIVHSDRKGLESLIDKSKIWTPSPEEDREIVSHLSGRTNVGPMQILALTRRTVKLQDWGDLCLGYLKGIAFTRRAMIEYVANKLGGVHYNSNRKPHDPNDVEQFRVLASAMDLDDQAIMPAGFVAVGLACIEVLSADGVRDLYRQIVTRLDERQKAIITKAQTAMAARDLTM